MSDTPVPAGPYHLHLQLTVNVSAEHFESIQMLTMALMALQHDEPDAALEHADRLLAAGTFAPVPDDPPPSVVGDEEPHLAPVLSMTADRKPWKDRIVDHLREHGPVHDKSGRAVQVLMDAVGATVTRQRFSVLIADLVAEGRVVREANARRTFRLAVPPAGHRAEVAILDEVLKAPDTIGPVEEVAPELLGVYVEDDELDDEPTFGRSGIRDPRGMKGDLDMTKKHKAAEGRDRPEPSGLAFERRPFDPEAARLRGIRAAWGTD